MSDLPSLTGANRTIAHPADSEHAPTRRRRIGRRGTFGKSGIAPIEALFNRGPFPVGGGASVVDATGWVLGSGSFATTTAPSMRMTIDLSDLDASRWNHLTGTSGHAFHPNYDDQFDAWQHGRQTPWLFTRERVEASAVDTLVLTPGD